MVDAVYLPFAEMPVNGLVKVFGAFQIPAEWFFDNHANPFAPRFAGTGKPRFIESFHYCPIQQRRHGEIKDATAFDIVLAVELRYFRGNRFVK